MKEYCCEHKSNGSSRFLITTLDIPCSSALFVITVGFAPLKMITGVIFTSACRMALHTNLMCTMGIMCICRELKTEGELEKLDGLTRQIEENKRRDYVRMRRVEMYQEEQHPNQVTTCNNVLQSFHYQKTMVRLKWLSLP